MLSTTVLIIIIVILIAANALQWLLHSHPKRCTPMDRLRNAGVNVNPPPKRPQPPRIK